MSDDQQSQQSGASPNRGGSGPKAEQIRESLDRYWVSNIRIMAILKVFWALAGLGCGIVLADWLNQFKLPGTAYPVGFWFAQQGSIIVFVLLILIYCLLMNRLDRKHHNEIEAIKQKPSGKGEGES